MIKASISVMSHLSDLSIEVGFAKESNDRKRMHMRAEFCKYLILKCDGDLNKEINVEEVYEEFSKNNTF